VATYVIGDIHGCWRTLERLLESIRWRPDEDDLWLVGDLVNRGPGSLAVLRWAVRHRERITAVLGNHDLHLLACAAGARVRVEDTFQSVLDAEDRDELLEWLRSRPLLVRNRGWVMVHAGLWPGWGLAEAEGLAHEVASVLAESGGISRLYPLRKQLWRNGISGVGRLGAALGVFTYIRVVDAGGRPRLGFTGRPDEAPRGCRPWFDEAQAIKEGVTVVFGHWAMLGLKRLRHAVCLDSGCFWGQSLSALRLEDGRLFQQPAVEAWPESCAEGDDRDA
jgi:bis(5'-nucleosyl)-tetraphosphatase (symmetrical)